MSEAQQLAIQGLLAFLPQLENQQTEYLRIGFWGDMTSRVSTETARNLYAYLYKHGFVLPGFDWQAWNEEALAYQQDRHLLQTADLETLYNILTAHLRADHFSEGHYDSILENGFLADVIRRIKEVSEW